MGGGEGGQDLTNMDTAITTQQHTTHGHRKIMDILNLMLRNREERGMSRKDHMKNCCQDTHYTCTTDFAKRDHRIAQSGLDAQCTTSMGLNTRMGQRLGGGGPSGPKGSPEGPGWDGSCGLQTFRWSSSVLPEYRKTFNLNKKTFNKRPLLDNAT